MKVSLFVIESLIFILFSPFLSYIFMADGDVMVAVWHVYSNELERDDEYFTFGADEYSRYEKLLYL